MLAISSILSLPSLGAGQTQTFRTCDVTDAICMGELVAASCSRPLPDEREPCIDILADLGRRLSLGEPEVLMGAAFAHWMLAEFPISEPDAASHRASAEQLYLQVIALDPARADAYLGLAGVADSPDDRVRWLRSAVEASNFDSLASRSLARALDGLGTYESGIEAADVMRTAYAHYEPGRHKWYLAHDVLLRYRRLGLDAEALRFGEQAKADYGPEARLDELADAASAPDSAIEILASLCSQEVASFVGANGCRTGVARIFAIAERVDDAELARELVIGALREVMALPSQAVASTWAEDMVSWLERLLRADIDSWELYSALGRCRLALDQSEAALAAFERASSIASESNAASRERADIDEYILSLRRSRVPDFYRQTCPTLVFETD